MNLEDEIKKVQRQRILSDEKYEKKLKALRKKLKKCAHKYTTEYWWGYDNGYGRQSERTGKQCLACNKVDHWSTGSWSDAIC